MTRTPARVVLLVGMPGSGKTSHCRTTLADHVRLSQDEGPRRFLALLARCVRLLEQGVERIVVDRTNPMRSQREAFIRLARARGCHVTIIHLDLPRDVCRDRILRRTDHPTLDCRRVDQAIGRYVDSLDPPEPDECDELVVVRE